MTTISITKRPPRLLRAIHRIYLQWRLRGVEFDVAGMEQQIEHTFEQIEVYEREAARYRVELALLED